MPTFRIVYIDDDTFRPRTLTAAFPDRATAEIAMAKHGHRVAHIAELGAGELPTGPVAVRMAPDAEQELARDKLGAPERANARAIAAQPLLGRPRHDLAGVAIVAAGLAVAGAAIFFL